TKTHYRTKHTETKHTNVYTFSVPASTQGPYQTTPVLPTETTATQVPYSTLPEIPGPIYSASQIPYF
ncbi:hypothetical protein GGI12_004444, partial [Dipsacomyces acuminosporus]